MNAAGKERAVPIVVLIGWLALSAGTGARAQEAAPDLSHVPNGPELEAQGAIIGEIRIVVGDVFATDTPEEDVGIFRLANTLHIETKPDVIRQQLLFATGQVYQQRLLDESERILRSQRYLFDAEIVPVRFQNGVVDLEVRTRDLWTLKPGVYYGRSGGENTSGIELQESNLLGFGKDVSIARHNGVDRTSNELRYWDPQILGSRNRFLGLYANNSDGRRRVVSLERPFYALDSRWSAAANALENDRTDQRYDLGYAVDEFRHLQEAVELGGGWSPGLQGGWVQRFTAGWRYQRDRFGPTESILSAVELPEDRELSYPYFGYTLFNDAYQERRNVDQIERTEDFFTGSMLVANVGYAREAWGSDRDAWIWNIFFGNGYESDRRAHTLLWNASAAGREEDHETHNLAGRASGRYYWRVTERQLFYASLTGAAVDRLDADRQLLLGGDNGLRGYPLRYQDGNAQALLTLEHRVFTPYYLFRLFRLGGAVFFDMGRSWGEGNAPARPGVDSNLGLLKDVGIGLRFGSNRSAYGKVIHVDLAFPLDGDPTIDRIQFVVESKASF